jgi:hypothetical protein
MDHSTYTSYTSSLHSPKLIYHPTSILMQNSSRSLPPIHPSLIHPVYCRADEPLRSTAAGCREGELASSDQSTAATPSTQGEQVHGMIPLLRRSKHS